MSERIKNIRKKQSDHSYVSYPLGADGQYVDLFNGLNLEEELKIGGGQHQVYIEDDTTPATYPNEFNQYITNYITQNSVLNSSTKIKEVYGYNNYRVLTSIDEWDNVNNYDLLTVIYIQLQSLADIGATFDGKTVIADNVEISDATTQIHQSDAAMILRRKGVFIYEYADKTDIEEVIV